MTCTFFGHRDVSEEIKPKLRQAIINLIENENVNKFYVGNHGHFDYMVIEILKELKQIYHFTYYIVLAYLPVEDDTRDYSNTVFPEGLNAVPYKYRIIERNKWMIKNSDYVITCVRHIGNSRDFKELAERNGKTVINITEC